MRRVKVAIARTPVLGFLVLVLYRAWTAFAYFWAPLSNVFKWLFTSREATNFTYDLEESNKRYLASLIADVTSQPYDVIIGYIQELEADGALRKHIADSVKTSDYAFMADKEARFGRRVGWYALARILKPKTIIETGVDKGLGACLLAAALKRNAQENHEGRYFGTDIDPAAGYLLAGDYATYGRILYGDSIESLEKFDGEIDLFINDSYHSAEYEAAEYKAIADKLSPQAVILGDNSHATDKLLEFSLQKNRHFVFFAERPKNHWYPGGGIGISFVR